MGRKKDNSGMFAVSKLKFQPTSQSLNSKKVIPSATYRMQGSGKFKTSSSIASVSFSQSSSMEAEGLLLDAQNNYRDNATQINTVSEMILAPSAEIPHIQMEDPSVDPAYTQHLLETSTADKNKRVYIKPRNAWLDDRDSFVAEDLRWEGLGDHSSGQCNFCEEKQANYRCIDCEGGSIFCADCIKSLHLRNGLHHIEKWTGSYFERVSLKSIGFRIQLGHPPGQHCISPMRAFNDDFTVIDTNGIHEIGLDFCNCTTAKEHYIQLLRYRWFPATVRNPKSAATYRALKHFQILTFESKCSAFEYYNSLSRLSDNTGTIKVKDRYRAFMDMIQEYQHTKMLKRSGRGHDPLGASSTKPGELAVLCPACPHPKMNLKDGWEKAPPLQRFLYCLFLAIDANFRLKRKNVSSDKLDPGLGPGWAYFVNEDIYKNYLKTYDKQIAQPPSTCSNHNAVNAERSLKGLSATGVGTVDCARHDCKRPGSVGDLQKGERYVNMDFLFFSSIANTELVETVVSYDIACQWSKNLWNRMEQYPAWMHVDHQDNKNFRFLIPKFHLPAHIMACQTPFSFNYNPFVGRTDGEAPERGWSHINPVAVSTREMGPGSRRDTLDNHFGDWNWKKSTLMGISLFKKLKSAVIERENNRFLFNQFTIGLPLQAVSLWKAELDEWEQDHSKPNPFESRFKTLTQASVRRALAEQDEALLKDGKAYIMHEDISASQLITLGIDLEDQQRRLMIEVNALGQHSTDDQKSKLIVRSNVLRQKINSWIDVQHLYVPSLRILRNRSHQGDSNSKEDRTESIPLFLPSSLDSSVVCDRRLQELEWVLRCAQANDALDDLRDALRLQSYLYIDKDRFQRGQRANTRSRSIIERVKVKISAAATKYRTARQALISLGSVLSKVGFVHQYPALLEKDIRGLKDPDTDSRRVSEGYRSVSWIWMRLGDGGQFDENEGLQDALRIEWCKAKARADRWTEEVDLLLEEMRRVKHFFESRAVQWEGITSSIGFKEGDDSIQAGRMAYAFQQAAMFRNMKEKCAQHWQFVNDYVNFGGAISYPYEDPNGEDGEDEHI